MLNSRCLNSKALNSSGSNNVAIASAPWETSSVWELTTLNGKTVSSQAWQTSSELSVDSFVYDVSLNLAPPLYRCFVSTPTFKLYKSWTAPLSASQLEQAA